MTGFGRAPFGASPFGGGTPPPLTVAVSDGFRTLDPARWEFTAGGPSVVNTGQLQIPTRYLDPGDTWLPRKPAQVFSVASGDLRDSSLTVEFVDAKLTGASAVVAAGVFPTGADPSSDSLRWELRWDTTSSWGTALVAVRVAGGVRTTVASLHPDAVQYRFLRISETAGTVTWFTSPDGLAFTAAASVLAVPAAATSSVRVLLGCWFESPGDAASMASVAVFDAVNLDPAAGDMPTLTGDDGEPYLAVDVQPDVVTGAFTVGRSLVGGPDRLAWSGDEPDTWVNVVCTVRAVSYRRGATRELGVLTTTEAGTATVLLEDTGGQFDPNMAGEAIRKGTPWRLRAWGTRVDGARWDAVLFTGELDTVESEYLPDEDAPLVTLTAVDLVGPLAAWESEGQPGDGSGAGDNLLQRALRILTTVGRGQVSAASSPGYTATLAPTALARPWSELQDAVEAELGRVWVDVHNRLQLRARGSQPSGPVRGTLSDVHPAADLGVHQCMEAARIIRGTEGMANRVMGRRRKLSTDATDPAQVRRDDELSQRMYGMATVNRSELALQTDAQVAAWASALVVARTRPELRVESVTPRPQPAELDLALDQWPAVLSTDLGDRWLFRVHPARGAPIVRGVAVLGIAVSITPGGWTVQWVTEAAPVPGASNPTGWFVVGLSTIGGSDQLAPYSAPYAAA